jgi:hypothetical protein
MRILPALAFSLIALPALAASPPLGAGYGAIDAPRDTDPVTLAQRFCDARVAQSDMGALARYFAPKLTRLLEQHASAHVATPVPWQSHEQRPTGCSLEVVNGFDDTIGVLVKLTYTANGTTWSDTLNLERTPDSWLINNVFYDGGGNLRFRLVNSLGS